MRPARSSRRRRSTGTGDLGARLAGRAERVADRARRVKREERKHERRARRDPPPAPVFVYDRADFEPATRGAPRAVLGTPRAPIGSRARRYDATPVADDAGPPPLGAAPADRSFAQTAARDFAPTGAAFPELGAPRPAPAPRSPRAARPPPSASAAPDVGAVVDGAGGAAALAAADFGASLRAAPATKSKKKGRTLALTGGGRRY